MEFAAHRPLLVLALVVTFLLLVGNELRRTMRGFREVGSAEATRLINDGALVIDLREPGSFKGGHVATAVNMPADRIDTQYEDIGKRAEKAGDAVIVYCDHGVTSARVAQQLVKQLPEKTVCHLKGGVTAWRQDNMPLKKG